MPATAPLRRSLPMTVLVGTVLIAVLWGGIQVGIHRSVAGVGAPADAAEREAIAAAAADGASRVVLLFGAIAILAAAVMAGTLGARRQILLRSIAERIERLHGIVQEGSASTPEPVVRIPQPPFAADRLLRRLAEAQVGIQRRMRKLDNERRRGFHVLDHMVDGVIAIDTDRRVLLLNPAARHLLGLARESSAGRRLAEVVRVPRIVAAVDAVLSGQEAQDAEVEFTGARERFLKVQAIPLPVDGAPGVLITVRDETQVKQLERMRREFIANVSHELKTPLAAVKGYAETLQLGAKQEPETCTHFLTQIGLQVERLERLINDMLQLARAQSGAENLTLTRVPLSPVLRESVAAYEPLARARDINLHFTPPSPAAAIIADREALLTITNNLLGNAVRYTPEGGNVELRCERSGDSWAIVVSDDGLGIPEQDQERIFERFYRVEKARDASRGGTGLGLSIVKNLVQSLGGQVHLQSQPGEGATFEVRLPAAG